MAKGRNSMFCKYKGNCPFLVLSVWKGYWEHRLQHMHRVRIKAEEYSAADPQTRERDINFFETLFEIQNSNPCVVLVKPSVLLIAGILRALFNLEKPCRYPEQGSNLQKGDRQKDWIWHVAAGQWPVRSTFKKHAEFWVQGQRWLYLVGDGSMIFHI